ncbi:uncharacterized protein B0P05DRAFT_590980 [Gilbertella persicaria]|uniref:uncharacterized protein n=1 Tax=Gilbertella persicaria TaxID=101096 RepID=UPI00222067E2|nr:uncharacterized protein B0P05DRAFT_590980 [Gilbertella persicaria]KAI8059418.1 hypothetical protein B0P05DRAFT_590980 [Gilbertella persicaria]
MQQQQIQERNVSFAILTKAQGVCVTWRRILNTSIGLLQSINNVISQRSAALEQPSVLDQHHVDQARLVFKQTESIEKTIRQLHEVMTLFEKVRNDCLQLEAEAIRHLTKSLTTVNKTIPLSTQSMIQITAVSPTQVHEWIANLAYMYNKEYCYKRTLLSNYHQTQDFIERWSKETAIDSTIESAISERLQLYKHVKKVLESVD